MAASLPLIQPSEWTASKPRRSIGFPLALGIVVAAVSLLPYLLAYWWSPPGRHFAGFFFIADDATTYLAKMRQGADGSWLWTDPYTSEPHGGVFLFGFYLLFGHLAAILHLPLIAAYHLARLSGALVLVAAAAGLLRRLGVVRDRNMALILIVFGSGLGFVIQALGNPAVFGTRLEALDLHLPELSGWYSILAIPHFVWATALIVIAFNGLLDLSNRPGWRTAAWTGAALVGLTAIHPQMIPVVGLIWLAYRGVLVVWGRRPSWASLLWEGGALIATLPLLAYNAWILYQDPTIAEWARQWRHQAPGVLSLAASLGLPLLVATLGMRTAWRRRDHALALAVVWPPLVIALLYLPNVANIQRRLLDAVYVPIGLLAAVGIRTLTARFKPARARRMQRALIPAFCLSSVIVMAIALRFATGSFTEAYVADDGWRAMAWLAANHQANDRALSAPGPGLLLPAWGGVNVYVGHYSETLDYFKKIHNLGTVLRAGESDTAAQRFFHDNGLTLLYWGPDEAKAGAFDPDARPWLHRIYRSGSVAIYRAQAS